MAKPAVFAELTFEDALERSRATGATLIVDAMAAWCGPCQTMDRTTWVDPAVVARLTEPDGPFAIQVDVDAEPDVAGELEVRAMPTLVAFVAGEERDRLVGGRRPADLLAWLDALARGLTMEEAQREVARALRERGARAEQLLARREYAAAVEEYRWLWEHARDAANRYTDVARQLGELVAADAAARAEVTRWRDAIAVGTELGALLDWTALNRALGDGERTLAWYAERGADLPVTPVYARFLEHAIVPLLVERDRWTEVGQVLRDPAELLRRAVAEPAAADEARALAGRYARALYAAARDERADDLEFEATTVDPSDAMRAVLAEARRLGRADREAWLTTSRARSRP